MAEVFMNSKPQTLTTATDNELLMRFVRAKDDECFEALVARHSSLVFQVCQTVLSNQADAEDAFQATFLVLIRKAKCLQQIGSLAAWLYKVAYRIAVRSSQTRRRKSTSLIVEEPQSEIDQFHNISQKEILSEVYAELSLLPQKYKEVLVECYLEGKTYREVAEATDSNEIAVKGRLSQAKKVLRKRLLKRGIALSFVLVILEQVRSSAAASSLTQAAVTTSLSSVALDATAKIPLSIQSLTSYGARNMTYTFGTKSTGIAVAALMAIFVPTIWILTQPTVGQETEGGLKLESSTQERDSAKITASQVTQSTTKTGLTDITASDIGNINSEEVTQSAEDKILAMFAKKSEVDWLDIPLDEGMDDLSARYSMPIEIDRTSLSDSGIAIDEPITVTANGRSLFSALNSAFRGVGLTFVIVDETLLITTVDAIAVNPDKYLTTRFYDLTEFESLGDEMVELIQSSVDPQSWESNAGLGTITYLQTGEKQLFVVRQKLTTHVRLGKFLGDFRHAKNGK